MWNPGCCSQRARTVVDEALELALLGRRVERPARLVASVPVREAEEVLQAAVAGEAVALEVEEEVAGRRLGERREALVRRHRLDQLVEAPTLPPRLVLHARLLPDPAQGRGAHAVDRGGDGKGEPAEGGHRRDVARDQPLPLGGRDAGHQREVVIGASPGRAVTVPVAEPAMLDRFRIGLRRGVRVRLEAAADGAVVGGVLDHPEAGVDAAVAPAEREVRPLGLAALHRGEQIGVEEELQERRAAGHGRQLRVDHLVRPGAQGARSLDPDQEVGVAAQRPSPLSRRPW